MKNQIERLAHDELATMQKIKDLAMFLEQLKSQQSPSIGLTSSSTADFAMPAYARATNRAADNTYSVFMTLNPPNNERLLGIPEIDMFGNIATPGLIAADQFPTGANWAAGGNNINFFDLDVWYDLWNNDGMGKQQAIAFIRGRSPAAINIKFVVRWRFIIPGAS